MTQVIFTVRREGGMDLHTTQSVLEAGVVVPGPTERWNQRQPELLSIL
ncbi:MAG: hypothetical protein RDU20_11930 [Desulfomonilaceae bacterium]|nr:hypothetical protein [Desulfomonilaceae bacterium]